MATPILHDNGISDGRRKRRPQAIATEEAVAGNVNSWLQSYLHTLPRHIDDVTRDFGDDLYERMKMDPQVRSDLNTIKLAVTNEGLNSSPAVGEEDPRYAQAVEIKLFCDYTTKNLRKPFLTATMRNMLDALAFGNKAAEKVYRSPEPDELAAFPTLQGKGDALLLDRLKVKPRRSIAYVVDAYMDLIGIAAVKPGMPYLISVGGFTLRPEDILPASKFAILAFGVSDEDPRGQSILRTAYNAWWLKMQTWGEYLAYLTRFASPSIALFMPENAKPYEEMDEETGELVTVDPWDTSELAVQSLKNGSYGLFSFGTLLQVLEAQGEGGAFTTAIDLFNREISKSILHQTLATMEGQHQARAASQTHENVLDSVVAHVKTWVEEFIENQVWKPAILINYGAEAVRLCPKASLGAASPSDNAEMFKAVAGLAKVNYFTPEQKQWIDANVLSIPPRTAEDVEEEKKRRDAVPVPAGDDPDDREDEEEEST